MTKFKMAMFFSYEELREICTKWAAGFFSDAVSAYVARDEDFHEDTWNIILKGLVADDRAKFEAMLEKYDNIGGCDADLEWSTDYEVSLPLWVSNNIVADILNMKIEKSIPAFDGIYLLILGVDDDSEELKGGISRTEDTDAKGKI